jgi:hypothetical protein
VNFKTNRVIFFEKPVLPDEGSVARPLVREGYRAFMSVRFGLKPDETIVI